MDRELKESHIIPKFMYKPIRDEKNRMRQLSLDKNQGNGKKYNLLQDGLKEYLLCLDCEKLLNSKYEQYFKKAWFDEKKLPDLLPNPEIKVTGLN
ncbi:MAG: hypothetical protein Q8Q40_15385 [Methylococcaceae bacterium]|nr:hypothetical protein [Methylococcaceae bacterium]